jgi:hypothetical protein
VSDQNDKHPIEEIASVSEELARALKLCHSIVDDYRSKLAANSNDPDSADSSEDLGRFG